MKKNQIKILVNGSLKKVTLHFYILVSDFFRRFSIAKFLSCVTALPWVFPGIFKNFFDFIVFFYYSIMMREYFLFNGDTKIRLGISEMKRGYHGEVVQP